MQGFYGVWVTIYRFPFYLNVSCSSIKQGISRILEVLVLDCKLSSDQRGITRPFCHPKSTVNRYTKLHSVSENLKRLSTCIGIDRFIVVSYDILRVYNKIYSFIVVVPYSYLFYRFTGLEPSRQLICFLLNVGFL